MATIDIRLRVHKELKTDAEAIFKQMGMTMSEAMRIFLSQCINSGGLPFKPHSKIPNAETIKALEESAKGIGVTSNVSVEEMLNEIYQELKEEGFNVEQHD
jgi:DNA-damage-inducible protein J